MMNILIVDDSHADTRLLQLWLRKSPWVKDVAAVTSGELALQYLRGEGPFTDRTRPDVMLLDSQLPDMAGLELLEILQQGPPNEAPPSETPPSGPSVVMLSGAFNPQDAQRARQLGAADYLAKPFDADDFEALVHRLEQLGSQRPSTRQDAARRGGDSPRE